MSLSEASALVAGDGAALDASATARAAIGANPRAAGAPSNAAAAHHACGRHPSARTASVRAAGSPSAARERVPLGS